MHNNWRDQLNFLLYNKTSLTFVLNALIDLYFLDSSRNPLFYYFQDHLSLSACKTSRISTWFTANYAKFAHFTKLPKVPTNKTNFKNYFLMEIIFQNAPNFIGTSGHQSRIPVPSMKLLAHLLPVFRHVDVYMY